MIMETWFYDKAQREAAIEALRAMPKRTRRLLKEAVEQQVLKRTSLSASATALENAGLLFCRQEWESWITTPSLWGEEALHRLEIRERKELA